MPQQEIQFIRRAKRTPNWAWVLYAGLAVLLITFILYQTFSVFQQAQERDRAFVAYYSSLKCTSLCPVESIADEEGKKRRMFDASCQSTCERIYLDKLPEREKERLDAEQFADDPAYVLFVNTTRTYASCSSRMSVNSSFDHFTCFQNLFFRVQQEFDLSNVRAPPFVYSSFSIEELSCNPFSIKVRLLYGASSNLSLLFILEDSSGKRVGFSSNSVPRLGESQRYSFTPRGLIPEKVAVFAQNVEDKRKATHEVWKDCPD